MARGWQDLTNHARVAASSPVAASASGEEDSMDDSIRDSAFVVAVHSPSSNGNYVEMDATTKTLHRMVTVGGESDYQVDYLSGKSPKLRIAVIRRRLVFHVIGAAVFFTAFTVGAYHGLAVYTFEASIGEPTRRAEALVELYNTFSGFLLALVEVLLGLFMHHFLPAYLVYLHNWLWFLHSSEAITKTTNAVRSTCMVLFPVLLMLLLGNSLRSLQATQSTVGFEYIMTSDDLRRERPLIREL